MSPLAKTLDALDTQIQAEFKEARDNVQDNLAGVIYDEMMTNKPLVALKALDGAGLMREFKSERVPGVVEKAITIAEVKKFERTLAINRDEIEDDDLGMVPAEVRTIGIASRRTPMAQIAKLLMQGFTLALKDGKPFFDATRGNLQTGELTADNLTAARLKIALQTAADESPLGHLADTLVVGPMMQAAAEAILNAQQIEGTTNTLYKTMKLVVSAYITDKSWYVVDTQEGVFPLRMVMRVRPDKIVAKTDENSDKAFDRDIFEWGSRGRFAPAYFMPKLIVGSTGEAA